MINFVMGVLYLVSFPLVIPFLIIRMAWELSGILFFDGDDDEDDDDRA